MVYSPKKRNKNNDGPNGDDLATSDGGPKAGDVGYPQPFLPSLSLIPESRLSLLRRRKATRKAFVVFFGVLAVVFAMIAVLLAAFFASRSAELTAVAQRDAANEEVGVLLPVQNLYEGFEERQTAVADALSSDMDYYSLVTTVQDAAQAEIPLDALSEDESGQWYVKDDYAHIGLVSYTVNASPCPSDQPFQPEPALGCLQGQAISSSYTAAGEAISALNEADNGLFGGYILNASDQDPIGRVGATSWSFSINFGTGLLSNKYAEESRAILGTNRGDGQSNQQPGTSPSPEPSPSTGGSN
jgi:uncharacterized membrane protein